MVRVSVKRGDTFILQCQLKDGDDPKTLVDWSVRSQIRSGSTLIAELTLTYIDRPLGKYRLRHANTTTWKPAVYLCDIRYTDPTGIIVSTETFEVEVPADITRDV